MAGVDPARAPGMGETVSYAWALGYGLLVGTAVLLGPWLAAGSPAWRPWAFAFSIGLAALAGVAAPFLLTADARRIGVAGLSGALFYWLLGPPIGEPWKLLWSLAFAAAFVVGALAGRALGTGGARAHGVPR